MAGDAQADAREFVVELGVALHRAGTPAHRLERALAKVARHLGEPAQVFTTPTQLLVAFGPLRDQRPVMVRVQPGDVDLGKLEALDAVADEVVAGDLDVAAGLARVRAIAGARPRFGRLATLVAFAATSAAVARFFAGGVPEIATSGAIGLAIGALAIATTRTVAGAHVFELLASLVAGAAAALAAHAGAGASAQITTLAGLIVLVPGFTLTVAMHELATRNLVSGTARLTAAGISFLEIGFGVTLGTLAVTRALGPTPPARGAPLPDWTEPVALVVAAIAIAVLFHARPRAMPGIVVACAAAFYGARLGAWLVGPELGASVGAFVVAAGSNLWARRTDRPAMVPLVPGLLLLVPGSLGFRSLTSLVQRDVIAGVDTAFAMALVAMSLVAGLLLAHAAVPPRRSL